jgi:hypothetical protein
MISSPPIVSVKIQNYHYEEVEIESKKTNEDAEYKEKKKNL